MTITFLTTQDERAAIRNLDLTTEADQDGLVYIMDKAIARYKK